MSAALPPVDASGGDGVGDELRRLLDTAHALWTAAEERRRMRAFGFRPAVEPGVLKRDWHGLAVRVGAAGIRAARPGAGELAWVAPERALLLNGEGFVDGPQARELADGILSLIAAYERWVEAREGREERIARTREAFPDRREVNALAETRRIQRLLHRAPR